MSGIEVMDGVQWFLFVVSLSCVLLFCDPMVTRLLSPWDFPGKITGVGCRLFLQGIFLTEGSNPCLLHFLHWEAGYLQLRHLGSPKSRIGDVQNEKTFYGMQEISDFP